MEPGIPKVVIQLSNDSFDIQKSMLAQVHNLLKTLPSVQIEVIVHSHGINFVFQNSHWQQKLQSLIDKGVRLLVCRNTLEDLRMKREDLLPFVEVIPSAVAHLVIQQQNGWSYLKAGF